MSPGSVRVLHVIATLDPHGAERQMVHLCRRLDRARFQPMVCCLTRGGALEADLAAAGVPVRVLHKQGRWDLAIMPRLIRLIREARPHVAHTWLPTSNTLGRAAAWIAGGTAIIASERAADAWKGPLRRLADRLLFRITDRVITNAEAVRRFLADSIGLNPNRITVIYNGLDPAEFDARLAAGLAHPVPDSGDAPVIGTVARLEPQKGIPHLLKAMSLLAGEAAKAQLWIAGDGPEAGTLRGMATSLRIDDRVRFLGARNDIPALMAKMDLFALPSLWEGLPNVAIEAQAARRAVVATAVDGTPEAVADGETGLLVPPADPAALAQAISALLANPARRRAMGEAGRRRVERLFSMERMVAETVRVYEEVLAAKGKA